MSPVIRTALEKPGAIVVYATAMGLLEAICVVYLRKVLLHGSKGPIEVAAIYPFISIESWARPARL